jgi:hypothetical protein
MIHPVLAISFLLLPLPAAADDDAAALADHLDHLYRGDTTVAELEMTVRRPGRENRSRVRLWSRGTDRTLLRVVEPARVAGMATLRRAGDLWNYLPGTGRTMRVPASLLSSPWMGSHLTHDDLVQWSRFRRDYDCRFGDPPGAGSVLLTCPAKPGAAAEYSRIDVVVRKSDRTPETQRFHDPAGRLVRTLDCDEVRDVGGRRVPTRLTVRPADAPDERTVLIYRDLRFGEPVDEALFTIQGLGTR